MYCRKCGKKLNDTDKFCSVCGTRVENQTVSFSGDRGFNLGTPKRPKREIKLDFTAPVMSWDVEDYPGARKSKKEEKGDVDFNWDTIVKNRGGDEGPEETDSIMTEEELFVKLTHDVGPVSGSTAAMWDLGSTARFEKPLGKSEDRFDDFVAPFKNPNPEFIDVTDEVEEAEIDDYGAPTFVNYDDRPTLVGFDDEPAPLYTDRPTITFYDRNPEEYEEEYLEESPQEGTIRPYTAPEEDLVAEMNEGIAASEAHRSSISRFYTFNKKSEEFKALLDQEYERLKARLEENQEEEETLAQKRAKLRAKAAAQEERRKREEALAEAKGEKVEKEVHWTGFPEFKAEDISAPEDESKKIEEADRTFTELLKESEPSLIFGDEPISWPELRFDEEPLPEEMEEPEEPEEAEAPEEASEPEEASAPEEANEPEEASATEEASAPEEVKRPDVKEDLTPVAFVLTKPSRVWTEVAEERAPRVEVAVPGVFGVSEDEYLDEQLEGQEVIDFSAIGTGPVEEPEEAEAEVLLEEAIRERAGDEKVEIVDIREVEEEESEPEEEAETALQPEDVQEAAAGANADAETDVVAGADTAVEVDAAKEIDAEGEDGERDAGDFAAEEPLEADILPVEEKDFAVASEEESEIDKIEAELAALEARLKMMEAGNANEAVESGEAVEAEESPSGEAPEAEKTAEEAAEKIAEEPVKAAPEEAAEAEEAAEDAQGEEPATGDTDQAEAQGPKRFVDIFNGEDEEAEKDKSSGKGRIIVLDILIFILTVLVILSAIMVFFEGSPLANRIHSGVDRIISVFTGNKTDDTNIENPGQIMSTVERAINNNLDKNKNIKSIAEDTALLYKEDTTYSVTGISDSASFNDSQWYTDEGGKAINYSDEIVGTIIAYYSQLVDKINQGDNSVLSLIDSGSQLYGTVNAISSDDSKGYGIDSLQIGSIRAKDNDYYVLIRLAEIEGEGNSPEITSKVIHLVADNKNMMISEIADVK